MENRSPARGRIAGPAGYLEQMRRALSIAAGLAAVLAAGCAPAVFVSQPLDATLYPEPTHDAVTFWGHASVYMDFAGTGIVTDPVFESTYSPIHGRTVPKPPPETYDQTSIILISHAHHDHLNPKTLSRFSSDAVILCPVPSEKYVRNLGPAVRVMRPGDEFPFPGGRVIAVPALHPGARWFGKAKADGRALGYVVTTPAVTVYYSGDTEYFPGIEEIGSRYRPDIAILNVNVHLEPEDALRAMFSLGSPRVIPIHRDAYGGRAARRGRKWRDEFDRLAGPLCLPLRVGESVALAGPGVPSTPGASSAAARTETGRAESGPAVESDHLK